MGSGLSRPTSYPFPIPLTGNESPPRHMWPFSKRKSRNDHHEKLDDFAVAKYPGPAGTFPFPHYPQMQSTFPAYYAPVQMALVQPFAIQQPVLAMPQAYIPMAYQTTAAPVQPAIVSATAAQPAPAMQMPAPAPGPAPAPPVSVAPQPPPVAPTQMPEVRPSNTPAQMPEPYPTGPIQAHVIPPSPIPSDPVIPPPPIINSDPRDSSRVRFTDFYRPADIPPVRPPTAGPPGRTPYTAPMQMPDPSSTPAQMPAPSLAPTQMSMPSSAPTQMPMPAPSSTPAPMPMPIPGAGPGPSTILRSSNPLPPPPQDIWDTSPYRQVLADLPKELPDLLGTQHHHRADIPIDEPEPMPRPSSRLGSLLGKDKGKKPMKGLFRSRSTAGHGDTGESSRHGHSRSQSITTIVVPPPVLGARAGPSGPGAVGSLPMDMPIPTAGPPIRFDHTGDLAGFVNHSPHRVMYKNKLYPTALHLLEALKFTHQPVLQERIRTCKDVHDMYPLSASLQEHVRPDWGQVFSNVMEDVLYLKFKQHPTLRALLLGTGLADIIYSDENTYWGDGLQGQGANELGKALVRLRERLRQEGVN